jgi:choline dehydrogenase-like flavoprotein
MIVDCHRFVDNDPDVSRTVIVGSGPVGLMLALHLSRRGCSVLVIEGGGPFASANVADDLQAEVSAGPLPGIIVGRTRQIGGGLNLWGGQLATLEAREFRPQDGCSVGWPIPQSEITSRFATVTELLGQPAVSLPPESHQFEAERSALAAAGLDIIATAWLKRPKLPGRIWHELGSSRNVNLIHGAFVYRIGLAPGSRAVNGVSALRSDGTSVVFAASNVVLACGAIETSRLLLQPSEAKDVQPWHSLPWLGRGFNEHLDAATATVRPLDPKRLLDLFDPILINGTKYTYKIFSQTREADCPALSSVAMLVMPGNLRNSLAELRMLIRGLTPRQALRPVGQIAAAVVASAHEIAPLAWRYLHHKRIGSTFRGEGVLRVSVEQPIRFTSCVTLSLTKLDSRGVPVACVHWRTGTEEGRAFLDATSKVKQWSEENGVAQIEIEPLLLKDPTAFAERADDGLHHAGGTRMAEHPRYGVVDTNLKVFGVEGVYCTGSAVFPRSGIANPTMTGMALAVRLGEHLIATGRAIGDRS